MTLAQIGDTLREILAAVKGAPALAMEVAEAKVKAADATGKLELATAEIASLKSTLASKDKEIADAKASAADTEAKAKSEAEANAKLIVAANEARDAAEAKAKDLVDNPSKVALEIAAKAGVKPDARPSAGLTTDAKPKGLSAVQASIAEEIKGKK